MHGQQNVKLRIELLACVATDQLSAL